MISILVRLKNPSKKKRAGWQTDQQQYALCVNWCVERIRDGEKLSSANVPFPLKAAIKNEAIRHANKAISDFKQGRSSRIPVFKSSLPLSINNQNWDTRQKNDRWYIGFTSNAGKVYVPVVENDIVRTYFPSFEKQDRRDVNRSFRGTMQLLRKGSAWYAAIPVEISCEWKASTYVPQTEIGIDLGLKAIAVISEPQSGKRQFFSGKQVGYMRRHFRSLRQSLGKKKALRALKRIGQKERRWMSDYNRKLAKQIVQFSLAFDKPVLKMEKLECIRETCKCTRHADRTIHSWAFYQLQQFIEEAAHKHGVPVQKIAPAYTSQQCFQCKHTVKDNRRRDRFQCQACGHRTHADLNAAHNIATSTSLAV